MAKQMTAAYEREIAKAKQQPIPQPTFDAAGGLKSCLMNRCGHETQRAPVPNAEIAVKVRDSRFSRINFAETCVSVSNSTE